MFTTQACNHVFTTQAITSVQPHRREASPTLSTPEPNPIHAGADWAGGERWQA